MKSILISIRPKWVAKILNGDKTIEIRKTAPKEWVNYLSGKTKKRPEPMTGYIYCTIGKTLESHFRYLIPNNPKPFILYDHDCRAKRYVGNKGQRGMDKENNLNGKVVAKFTLKEVERYVNGACKTLCPEEFLGILGDSCLSKEELEEYAGVNMSFYVLRISDLVIFDEQKELNNFRKVGYKSDDYNEAIREAEFILTMDHVFRNGPDAKVSDHQFQKECEDAADEIFKIKRAPQSWCYVEVAE